jgi:hypothetical protein
MKEVPMETEKHCRVLKEVWWNGWEWICVVRDRDKFYSVVSMVLNLQILCSTENFWTRWGTDEKNSSLWLFWRVPPPPTFAYIYNSFCYFHMAVIFWEHKNYICWPCIGGRALKLLVGSLWPWWFLNADKGYCARGEVLSDGEIACCGRQNTLYLSGMLCKDESIKNFVCREMSFQCMLTIIAKIYSTNFSVKLLSKWWSKMLPVTYEVQCDSLEDILHEMLVCTYCSFRCNVWCHFLRVSGRSHFRNIFVLISYLLLYVHCCLWVTLY